MTWDSSWRRLGRGPCGRYVDDFFGAGRHDIEFTSGVLLEIVTMLVGTRCDPQKAANFMFTMIVLGAEIMIDFATKSYSTRGTKEGQEMGEKDAAKPGG